MLLGVALFAGFCYFVECNRHNRVRYAGRRAIAGLNISPSKSDRRYALLVEEGGVSEVS